MNIDGRIFLFQKRFGKPLGADLKDELKILFEKGMELGAEKEAIPGKST